jgi:alkylation response protein AidB-like acyl-CoA dehydrogenase
MKLARDNDVEKLRAEVRAFIEAKRPVLTGARKAGVRAPEPDDIPALRERTRQLFAAGYIGGDWPADWGGAGALDPVRAAVVGEEMARARVPMPPGAGLLAAMALIHFGSQEQKARFLPRIRSGEHIWCQLFCEPGAGSDLASLRPRAWTWD